MCPTSKGEIELPPAEQLTGRRYKYKGGAASGPEGIVTGSAFTTPVQCSPRQDASHLSLGRLLPLLVVYRHYPPL
jgi:hypothetical protein